MCAFIKADKKTRVKLADTPAHTIHSVCINCFPADVSQDNQIFMFKQS